MADLRECLVKRLGEADPRITDRFKQDALDMFDRFYNSSEALLLDPAKRVEFATDETIALLEGELQHQTRIDLQTTMAKLELMQYLDEAADPYAALEGLANPRAGVGIVKNLYLQEKTNLARITSPLDQFIIKLKKSELTGSRLGPKKGPLSGAQKEKLTLLQDIIRELHDPGATKNKVASELAIAYTEAAEHARLLYNQSGGAIRLNKSWALPQPHHAGKIMHVGAEKWKADIKPLLNRDAMLDNATGLKMTDEELDELLNEVYQSIVTDGRNKLDTIVTGNMSGTGKSIAKRHLEHRVLNFADGDAYMAYQKMYGEHDTFDVMMNHLRSMAKDITSMQVLGPNAESTVTFLKQYVKQIADRQVADGANPKVLNRADRAGLLFDAMWQIHKGLPESPNASFNTFMKNYRALLMATRLGSTPLIAAPTDMMTVRKMAKMNGMSQWRAVGGYLRELFRFNKSERSQLAAELGMMNESMMDGTSSALARYLHEDNATPFFQFIVDSSLRLNGLTHITQSGRHWAGMMMMSNMAKNTGKGFTELTPGMQKGLARYGITADKWEKIRTAKLYSKQFSGQDINYLRAEDIAKIEGLGTGEARELADSYMRMVFGEMEVAVPTVSYLERAKLTGVTPPGTMAGEITRSFAMFKSWPFAFYHNHIQRAWMEADTPLQKANALADTFLFMTIGGALGVQLMEITKGRKPMDTDPTTEAGRRFWGNAMLRSGGFGPLFDVAAGLGDYRQGLSGYVAGPVIGAMDSIGYALFGSGKDLIEGKEDVGAKFKTRAMKEVISHTPYQSNWMINLVMKRLLWEKILLWNDPSYIKQINRSVRRDYREGKEYWWKPNEDRPRENPFD
jgi:uncharacterized protein (UPF0297 family)